MFVFGEPAPRPLQWWAPWVHAVVLGIIAGVLTYGTVTWGAPPDRGGSSTEMWMIIAMLWLVVILAIGRGTLLAMRRARPPKDD